MKLKHLFIALTAMLWSFSLTANAQVAKIGETPYETFAEALEAAEAMTDDVTVEIYDKVTFNQPLIGNYTSINFVGKAENAEMYLDVQGYTTATGKEVTFTDLKLSKSVGGHIANAGFMNVAFGIYDVVEVTYNKCTFLNGAYASSGEVTFNGCTFYRSHDRYGLWAYGAPSVTVDGCTFADIRGIKLWDEGNQNLGALTVKNTNFSAVTDKPAIVLTSGKSVVLAGNTYNADKGTFELDLDGNPNGTPVTSDVAPVCVNDNGACGVLVDGKIYTTVAQAAEVATSGSTVKLLHNSAETVELAEGVVLDKNGFEAAGVTVYVKPPVAKIGDTPYYSLSEAFAAVTDDAQTVVVLKDVTENLTSTLRGNITTENGAKVTITLTNSDWVYCPYTFVIGENVTLNVPALFYYAGDAQINGTVTADAYYQRYAGTKLTINEPGSMIVTSETCIIRLTDGDANAGIYVVGDNNDETVGLKTSVIYFYQGMINAKDANIVTGTYWQTNETDGQGSANLVLDNSTLNVTIKEQNAKATGKSTVTLKNGATMTCAGGLDVAATASFNVEGSTLSVKGVTTPNKQLFISGNSVVKIDNLNGRATVLDETVLTDSYIKSPTNGTTRVLGDLTLNGGFQAAYFMTAGSATSTSGYEGTITIEGEKVLKASYGLEFNGKTTFNGGTLELSEGNKDKGLWGCVFQNGEFVLNTDVVVTGNTGTYAPIHFTDATATINSSITQTNSGGEPLYIGKNSVVTLGKDALINVLSVHGAGKLIIDAEGMNAGEYANVECGASGFTGTLEVINNDKLEAKIVDGKIVLAAKPVAKIGDTPYYSLSEAVAAAQAGDAIELLADVNADAVILLGKSLTINGNGHKVTSSATRVFRVTTANTEVTLNDVKMVNTAVRVGENDIRGISVDNVANVELTLNNCSVDFTDASACDWAYAVNVTGGNNHVVTVNGGTYEGANVINVRGANNTVTVNNATLTSLYPNNDVYYGACIYVVQDQNSSVNAKGNTFNGANAVSINAGYTPVTESNNTDNTTMCVAKIGDVYYTSLADAFAAGGEVKVLQNIVLAETAIVPAGKIVALDLNGKAISQTKACTASYEMINNKGNLTITGNGKISFTDTSAGDPSFGWGSYTVRNEGNLVVENGTIEHKGAQAFATHMICAIFQYSGSTTINGGTISTPNYRSARLWQGDMTINGGEFDGQLWVQAVNDNAKLTINGGTFAPNGGDGSSVFVGNVDSQDKLHKVEFAVTDGTFTTKIGCSNADEIEGDGIKGGKFTEAAKNNTNSALLAEGFVFAGETVNGYYGVKADPNYIAEFIIDDAKGENFVNDSEKTVGTLTYKRTLVEDAWNPLYVPFALPMSELIDNYDVAYYNDVHAFDDDNDGTYERTTIELIKVADQNKVLKASYPLIIRPKSADVKNLELILTDVTLSKAIENKIYMKSASHDFEIMGTYTKRESLVYTESVTQYVLGREKETGLPKWITTTTESLNPYRLILTVTSRGNVDLPFQAISMRIVGEETEDGTTFIYDVEMDSEQTVNYIYDLQGRRVLEPQKGNLYIINGKKVVIK